MIIYLLFNLNLILYECFRYNMIRSVYINNLNYKKSIRSDWFTNSILLIAFLCFFTNYCSFLTRIMEIIQNTCIIASLTISWKIDSCSISLNSTKQWVRCPNIENYRTILIVWPRFSTDSVVLI